MHCQGLAPIKSMFGLCNVSKILRCQKGQIMAKLMSFCRHTQKAWSWKWSPSLSLYRLNAGLKRPSFRTIATRSKSEMRKISMGKFNRIKLRSKVSSSLDLLTYIWAIADRRDYCRLGQNSWVRIPNRWHIPPNQSDLKISKQPRGND